MARVKTFTNGGSVLPGDLNSIEDDYEFAFSTYKQTIMGVTGSSATGGAAATVYRLDEGNVSAFAVLANTPGAGTVPFYFDPADWTGNTRTTKLRVRANIQVGATAPAVTFTAGLYPISAVAAGNYTVGTVTAGSTIAFASPGTNTMTFGNSGDFTAPASGYYALGYTVSGATAASSNWALRAALQMREV